MIRESRYRDLFSQNPARRSGFCLLGLLLFLIAFGQAHAQASAQPAAGQISIIGRRLEGRWSADAGLSRRLTGRGDQIPGLVFEIDPQVLERLSKEAEPPLQESLMAAAGHLSIGGGPFLFALTADGSNPVLLVFPVKEEKVGHPFRLYLALAPARNFEADLLFVGGAHPTEPFFAYSRTPSPEESGLTEATRGDLHAILHGHLSPQLDAALAALPGKPDWEPALHYVLETIRYTLPEDQNNACLAAYRILREHERAPIHLDLSPLLTALELPIWNTQQKCAEAVGSYVAHRQVPAASKKAILAALIPLTASLRGRVVDPALRGLAALSGQSFGRDPSAWARWFETTFGATVDLASENYETLAVVRSHKEPEGEAVRYSINGAKPQDLDSTVRTLEVMAQEAGGKGEPLSVVIQVPDVVFASNSGDQIMQAGGPLLERLQKAGIGRVTISPESDRFYVPTSQSVPSKDASRQK